MQRLSNNLTTSFPWPGIRFLSLSRVHDGFHRVIDGRVLRTARRAAQPVGNAGDWRRARKRNGVTGQFGAMAAPAEYELQDAGTVMSARARAIKVPPTLRNAPWSPVLVLGYEGTRFF